MASRPNELAPKKLTAIILEKQRMAFSIKLLK